VAMASWSEALPVSHLCSCVTPSPRLYPGFTGPQEWVGRKDRHAPELRLSVAQCAYVLSVCAPLMWMRGVPSRGWGSLIAFWVPSRRRRAGAQAWLRLEAEGG